MNLGAGLHEGIQFIKSSFYREIHPNVQPVWRKSFVVCAGVCGTCAILHIRQFNQSLSITIVVARAALYPIFCFFNKARSYRVFVQVIHFCCKNIPPVNN